MKKKTLIVTSKDDAHADYIIAKCNNNGLGDRVVRLNTENFVSNCDVTFNIDGFHLLIKDSERELSSQEVKAVWYRRPKDFDLSEESSMEVAAFVKQQSTAFLRGVYFCCHDAATWVNSLTSLHRSRNKLQQLQAASWIGLNPPKTLITNKWQDAINFCNSFERICTKSLDEPNFKLDGNIYPVFTRIVEKTELLNNQSSFERCPVFLQEYIAKKLDIRVVIIGEDIFAFEIHSQENPLSVHDFRGANPTLLRHIQHELPLQIRENIHKFMHKEGLIFSAMDFVLSVDNRYYFLENNPNGQWLWLEQITDVPLSQSMMRLLFSRNS